jgi:MYND finger
MEIYLIALLQQHRMEQRAKRWRPNDPQILSVTDEYLTLSKRVRLALAERGFSFLPEDVQRLIAQVDVPTLMSLAPTNKMFAELASSNHIWQYFFERDFPEDYGYRNGQIPFYVTDANDISIRGVDYNRDSAIVIPQAWKREYLRTRLYYNQSWKVWEPYLPLLPEEDLDFTKKYNAIMDHVIEAEEEVYWPHGQDALPVFFPSFRAIIARKFIKWFDQNTIAGPAIAQAGHKFPPLPRLTPMGYKEKFGEKAMKTWLSYFITGASVGSLYLRTVDENSQSIETVKMASSVGLFEGFTVRALERNINDARDEIVRWRQKFGNNLFNASRREAFEQWLRRQARFRYTAPLFLPFLTATEEEKETEIKRALQWWDFLAHVSNNRTLFCYMYLASNALLQTPNIPSFHIWSVANPEFFELYLMPHNDRTMRARDAIAALTVWRNVEMNTTPWKRFAEAGEVRNAIRRFIIVSIPDIVSLNPERREQHIDHLIKAFPSFLQNLYHYNTLYRNVFHKIILAKNLVCAVCEENAWAICGNCFTASYCCKEHQALDWKEHKLKCF